MKGSKAERNLHTYIYRTCETFEVASSHQYKRIGGVSCEESSQKKKKTNENILAEYFFYE